MPAYNERIQNFTAKSQKHSGEALTYSLLRGFSFIGLVVCGVFYFQESDPYWLIGAVLLLIGFILFIGQHRKHEALKEYYEALIGINQEELRRSDLKLTEFESGEEHLIDNHPNQHDLDTFGKHSLYQLINRCATNDGKKLLARWLSMQPSDQDIIERQEAVKELSNDLDWLQRMHAKSRISVGKKKKNEPTVTADDLLRWSVLKSNTGNRMLWQVIGSILVLGIVTTSIFVILDKLPYQVIYLNVFINLIALGSIFKKLNLEMKGIGKAQYLINSYLEVLQVIQSKAYSASLLNKLTDELTQPHKAEIGIRELNQIGHRVSARDNMLYGIADLLVVPDIFLLLRIYRWKATYERDISKWLDALHQFEVLMSIASFAHQHPSYQYPQLSESDFELSGIAIGHPLIAADIRVNNDYEIKETGAVDIITGSNMSGKSTFQRTLGINIILARLGAPVCAESFRFSNVEVFTSMRTKDNLSENTSSFYAELKRISQLLETVEKQSTFFLLDEILKGTNSEDRHLGAVALAEKLSTKNAFGLISTHDLTLGALEQTNDHIRNFSFNSEIKGNKIIFDYRLTPGPCKSFNASQLMRNMGIIE